MKSDPISASLGRDLIIQPTSSTWFPLTPKSTINRYNICIWGLEIDYIYKGFIALISIVLVLKNISVFWPSSYRFFHSSEYFPMHIVDVQDLSVITM